jgi:hypothetical protein
MAKPRVFISSTYYDLKHIRASLDLFIDSLGFEPVLSEKGDIAFTHDRALDESCYREAENSDVFVLIVGGRYGSEASGGDKKPSHAFFDRYESITKKEYESAVSRDIPVYVLIEKGVNSEYQTFLRNKDKTDISYAHVESVNVFHFIEDILSRPRNNPVQTFEKFIEIETWLREQWAGLFRELLRRQSQQQQLVGLTTQVAELKEVNDTLRKYLEAVMKGADRQETSRLIKSEEKRLEELRRLEKLRGNRWVQHTISAADVDFETVARAIEECSDENDFFTRIQAATKRPTDGLQRTLRTSRMAKTDFNEAREAAGVKSINFSSSDDDFPTREPRQLRVKRETVTRTSSKLASTRGGATSAKKKASTSTEAPVSVRAVRSSKTSVKKPTTKRGPAAKK